MQSLKSPENNGGKNNNNFRTKKLSSASQRAMSRKRSQQHLDLQLCDGDETEEDLLLNDEKKSKTKRTQNNGITNTSPVGTITECNNHVVVTENSSNKCNGNSSHITTKNRKPKKGSKQQSKTSACGGGDEINAKKETTSLPFCHNQNIKGDEVLQNEDNGGGNCCHKQLSSNRFHEDGDIGMMDRPKSVGEEAETKDHHIRKEMVSAHQNVGQFTADKVSVANRQKQMDCTNISGTSIPSCSLMQHQQPDIVSWFPLLSKTSAMQCNKNDSNNDTTFRTNVEMPFTSLSSKNGVQRNNFMCDDIASPKLAAKHAFVLEQAAAKQAAIRQSKRTPSLCFDVSASENSDNECHNEVPLLDTKR